MSGVKGARRLRPSDAKDKYHQGFLEELDLRCVRVRQLLARRQALASAQGGEDQLSYMRRSLCDRFIHLERWLEKQERAMLDGQPINEQLYFSGLCAYSGLLNKLGLERRTKPVNLLTYTQQTKETT